MIVVGTYDSLLVGVSVLIAIFASYSALDLAGRVRASAGWARRTWLAASALAMGGGIWSMHFLAMLAFRIPGMEVAYDPGLTLLSLLVPIGVTGASFVVMSRFGVSWRSLVGAGLFMGLGIVFMHYTGMAAMRMAGDIRYDRLWVAASVAIAIVAATAALWLSSRNSHQMERLAAAVAMGVAIAGMHYSAMQGAVFTMDVGRSRPAAAGASQAALAAGVSAATFLILFLSLAAAMYDRRLTLLGQREAEALRQSEERFRSLYRGTPLPLHSLDRQGRLEQISNTWLDLLGYRLDEVVGRPLADFFTPESAAQFNQVDWPKLIEHDVLAPKDYRVRTKGGDVLDVVSAARVERNETGAFLHVLGGLTDVTARKRAEDALRQTQKLEAIGKLTGGVAHDFNNLLAVVSGSLELLRKRLPEGDQKARQLMEGAQEAARRGAALTQRLLAFARRQDLRQEAVDVPKLVIGMAEMLQRTLGPQVRVQTHFPLGLACALIDPHQLELAVLNLAVNARDAMPSGGAIEISAVEIPPEEAEARELEPGRYLQLSVADVGDGMDAETLARAAEPFFTTKGVGKGTGLGLSMVQGFAAQSGGRLELKSELGRGTTVELYLPISTLEPTRQGAERPKEGPSSSAHRHSILVVDDDLLVLTNTAAMLEDLGHAVLTANSGRAALAQLAQGAECDLLITDQLMPEMMGVQLAEAARAERPGLRVLLVSGFAELNGEDAKGLMLLRKPFDQAALDKAIETLSAQAQIIPLRKAGQA